MHLQNIMAITFSPGLGMRGAMTTPADLLRYKRKGFLRDLSQHVHLVCQGRLEANNACGAGNRWRRRWMRLCMDRVHTKNAAAFARSFDPRPADMAADTATEGYARRLFRTNPHD